VAALAYLDRDLGEQCRSPRHKGSPGDYFFVIGFVLVAVLLGCVALVWLHSGATSTPQMNELSPTGRNAFGSM
jgi:hypothetical protein